MAIVAKLVLATLAFCQGSTFRSANDAGEWHSVQTWVPNAVPNQNDQAIVAGTAQAPAVVTIPASDDAHVSLLKVGWPVASSGTIDLRGTLSVEAGENARFRNAGRVFVGGRDGVGSLIQGPGSRVTIERSLQVGNEPASQGLYIIDNAVLSVEKAIRLAEAKTGEGTLSIVGAAEVRASSLIMGAGDTTLAYEMSATASPSVSIRKLAQIEGQLDARLEAGVMANELLLVEIDNSGERTGGFHTVRITPPEGVNYELSYSGGDGNDIALVRQDVPLNSYAAWREYQFANSHNSTPHADPDQDGIANLGEYKLGRAPLVFEASAGMLRKENGRTKLRYVERTDRQDVVITPLARPVGGLWSAKGVTKRVLEETSISRTVELTADDPNAELRLGFSQQPVTSPNIVFILVDDMGWADNGINDPSFYTPTMKTLSEEGVSFSHHYVHPQCTPTRVALLTGRYPSRFGTQANHAGSNRQAIPFGTPTLAGRLGDAGYRTAIVGKWHLGSVPQQGPQHFGFNQSYGSLAGAVGAYDHRYRLAKPWFVNTWHRNGQLIPGAESGEPFSAGTHVTDLLTDDAVRFIQNSDDSPFLLYVAFTALHTPFAEEPKWFESPDGRIERIANPDRRLMAAAAHHLDDAVRRIVLALDDNDKRDNTLLVFTSDNGGIRRTVEGGAYAAPDPTMHDGFSSNGLLRGQKGETYEGGIRVPTFASWPTQLKTRTVSQPVHIVDWFPTFTQLADANTDGIALDGTNIWGLVHDGVEIPNRSLYFSWGKNWDRFALRRRRWKIVSEDAGASWQLFDLLKDPFEQDDQASVRPDVVNRLLAAVNEKRQEDLQEYVISGWIDGPDSFQQNVNFDITVRFSEALTEPLDVSKLIIAGGTLVDVHGEGNEYFATIKPTASEVRMRLEAGAGVKTTRSGSRSSVVSSEVLFEAN